MKDILRNVVKKGRQSEFVWRYGFNFRPSVGYKLNGSAGSDRAASKVIKDLNRNGIAVTTVDECLGENACFAELEAAVADLLEKRSGELEQLKAKATDKAIGEKTFNVELLGSPVDFDPQSVFARFALQKTLLSIANAYFGMLVKLRYYNVWYTFATNAEARESQLWHFDREDNYILKIFLYLRDVDEGAGPFTYAPQTHRKGKLSGRQPAYHLEQNVRRSTDEQMAAVVPEADWVRATGKKGTIVFADTRGFHKGGEARTEDRLMYTCMFTSPASQSARLLKFTGGEDLKQFDEFQRAALYFR